MEPSTILNLALINAPMYLWGVVARIIGLRILPDDHSKYLMLMTHKCPGAVFILIALNYLRSVFTLCEGQLYG